MTLKPLPKVLIDRPDTVFNGSQLDPGRDEAMIATIRSGTHPTGDSYVDQQDNYYSCRNDYVEVTVSDEKAVGILVADYDAKHVDVDFPYPYLPCLMGLFVREPYRGRGIGSELVSGFMSHVNRQKAVIDIKAGVKSFYEGLDYEMIYLGEFKDHNHDHDHLSQ